MNDRRRVNGPLGGTIAPIYAKLLAPSTSEAHRRPTRTREPNKLRKMCKVPHKMQLQDTNRSVLRTGVTPSASGSAYLELESSAPAISSLGLSSLSTSGLKLTCTVHGPRPLPRSAPFSPHIILSTHIKYAPFATRQRRGYLRDSCERDLAVHLETALRGVIIGDRWPKSGVEVIITILESEANQWWGSAQGSDGTGGQWGMMSVLSGCITVASAAIADAGIDCVDTVAGGIAALIRVPEAENGQMAVVLDPVPSEHYDLMAACVVGYLPSRDEMTDVWVRGEMVSVTFGVDDVAVYELLVDGAVQAALGAHSVLSAALKESAGSKIKR